jgi:Ribose/Galactose Isomerase
MNILCLGGRTTGIGVAWDYTKNFLGARFSGADRHRRRLAKVTQLECSTIATRAINSSSQVTEPEIIGANNDVA